LSLSTSFRAVLRRSLRLGRRHRPVLIRFDLGDQSDRNEEKQQSLAHAQPGIRLPQLEIFELNAQPVEQLPAPPRQGHPAGRSLVVNQHDWNVGHGVLLGDAAQQFVILRHRIARGINTDGAQHIVLIIKVELTIAAL
jgi:hypothetical protein